MKRELFILRAASAELEAATDWYERRRSGLGAELIVEIERAYELLAAGEHGLAVPGVTADARRLHVPRFPLWIIFTEHPGEVIIVAYAHERRGPAYWKQRLRPTRRARRRRA